MYLKYFTLFCCPLGLFVSDKASCGRIVVFYPSAAHRLFVRNANGFYRSDVGFVIINAANSRMCV